MVIPPQRVDDAAIRKVRSRCGFRFRTLFMTTLVLLQVAAVSGIPVVKQAKETVNWPLRLGGKYDLFPFAERFAALLQGFAYAENALRGLDMPGQTSPPTGARAPTSKISPSGEKPSAPSPQSKPSGETKSSGEKPTGDKSTEEKPTAKEAEKGTEKPPLSGVTSLDRQKPPIAETKPAAQEPSKPLTEHEKLVALATGQTVRQTKTPGCPKFLHLSVSSSSRGLEYQLDAPLEMYELSPSVNFPTLSNVSPKYPFFDSRIAPIDQPKYLPSNSWQFSASGKDLLKCPSTSFSRFHVMDFSQYLLGELQSKRGLKIPRGAVNFLFGRTHATRTSSREPELPDSWKDSQLIEEARKELRMAFQEMGSVPLIVLDKNTVTERSGAYHRECFYVKSSKELQTKKGPPPGAAPQKPKKPMDSFREHTGELFENMVPVIMKSVVKPFKPAKSLLQLTDHRCKATARDTIERIEIEASSLEAGTTQKVRIDNKSCGTVTMGRLLELENSLKDQSLGKKALRIVEGAEEQLDARVMGAAEMDEEFKKGAPEKFVLEINEAIAKTLVTFGSVDVSRCRHLKDKTGFGLIVFDVPTAAFCKDKVPFNCKSLQDGRTAIVTRLSEKQEPCLYSSGRSLKPAFYGEADREHEREREEHDHEEMEKMIARKRAKRRASIPKKPSPLTGASIPGDKIVAPEIHKRTISVPKPPSPLTGGITRHTHGVPRTLENPQQSIPNIPKTPKGGIGPLHKAFACFPASARVLRSDGRFIMMRDLRVGDEVEVAPGVFSPVLMFSHADPGVVTRMIVLESASGKLIASRSHYVLSDGELVAAGNIKVGDFIAVKRWDGLVHERVLQVAEEDAIGLYNPQTKDGSILVLIAGAAPVLASVYTTAVPPPVAHLLLAPLRGLYDAFGVTFPGISRLFPGTHIWRTAEGETIVGRLVRSGMTGLSGKQ